MDKIELLEHVLDAANDGYYEWNMQTGEAYFSPRYYTMLGYKQDEFSASYDMWIALLHPEDKEHATDTLKALIEGKKDNYDIEYRLKDNTNEWLWILSRGKVVERDSKGKPVRMVGIHINITERKKAVEALQTISSRNESLLASIPDIIMEVDRNKVYTFANKAGVEFFGNDVIGKEAAYYFEGKQDTYNIVQPLFEGHEGIFYLESWQRRKDGEKRLLAWWCRVIKDNNGNVAGALSSARDITEQKRAEEELKKRVGELEQFYQMSVTREIKMKGLKSEIDKLKSEISKYNK